jgi:VWFA-related protein
MGRRPAGPGVESDVMRNAAGCRGGGPGRMAFLALVAVLMTVSAGPLSAQVFTARVDLVHMPVVVTDRDGRVVTGLTVDDFEVADGGRLRPVVTFAQGAPPPEAGVPLHLGVMLDESESMELDTRVAAGAVVRFVETMPEATDVTLVEFDATVRVSRFSPNAYPHLFERVRDIDPDGGHGTALYDAIARYVDGAAERDGLHLLLVYTDGGDSGRGLNAADVQRRLRQSNVLVYGIVYLENQPPSDRARQRAIATQLMRESGGEAFFPSSERDVTAIYERIRNEMASRYTLGYVLPADAMPGQYRRVDVRLKDPSGRGLRVRARPGYLVPEP